MSETLLSSGHQFMQWTRSKTNLMQRGYMAGRRQARPLQPTGIAFVGMGGSGVAGRLAADALQTAVDHPVLLVQDYQLPKAVGAGWLVVAISYSGNTEETMEAVRQANSRSATVVTFSGGGVIAERSALNIMQPSGYQPRAIIGHVWLSILGFLEGAGLIPGGVPIERILKVVAEQDLLCVPDVTEGNPARDLAHHLELGMAHFYCTPDFEGVARFAAGLLNETAKRIAHVQVLPEANHNDLMGWSSDPRRTMASVLILGRAAPGSQMFKRIEHMSSTYADYGVACQTLLTDRVHGLQDMLVEQAAMVQLLEYASLYVAEARGVDPADIQAVEELKRSLI